MARIARALAVVSGILLGPAACATAPRVASVPDPAGAHRFEIVDVGDTTFRFLVGGARWIQPGAVGIAVDPRRRDALVARFVVAARRADTVLAIVTGQTARVATTQVALLDVPPKRYTLRQAFWLGVLAGGVVGTSGALAARGR